MMELKVMSSFTLPEMTAPDGIVLQQFKEQVQPEHNSQGALILQVFTPHG